MGGTGLAVNTNINQPSGLACDATGNLYIIDRGVRTGATTSNGPCRVYKVDVGTGVVSVVAGATTTGFSGDTGLAVNAEFCFPTGVTIHSSGDVYICDQGNQRVRKIDHITKVITTVAGNGTMGFGGDGAPATLANLNEPNAVAFDTAGNMFISDEGNHRIRRVDVTSGFISTVVGVGTAGFSGDGGSALAAQLNNPGDIKVDTAGNLYLADSQNRRLRMVTGTTITTLVGNGGANYGEGAGGLPASITLGYFWDVNLLDPAGNSLSITDFYSRRIWRIDRLPSPGTTAAIGGGYRPVNASATGIWIGNPTDVAFDSSGKAYLADYTANSVQRFDPSNGTISIIAGNGVTALTAGGGLAVNAGVPNPESVAVDGSRLYIACANRIWMVDLVSGIISIYAGTGTGGAAGDGSQATAATVGHPRGLALNAAGDLYFADNQYYKVRKITKATGVISLVAGDGTNTTSGNGGSALTAGIADPRDLTVLSNGDVVITDLTAGLRLVSGGMITAVGTLASARGIVADANDNCFCFDLESGPAFERWHLERHAGRRHRHSGVCRRWRAGHQCLAQHAAWPRLRWRRTTAHRRPHQPAHPPRGDLRDAGSSVATTGWRAGKPASIFERRQVWLRLRGGDADPVARHGADRRAVAPSVTHRLMSVCGRQGVGSSYSSD